MPAANNVKCGNASLFWMCVQTCGVLFNLKMRHTFICKHAFRFCYDNIWCRKYIFRCILFWVCFIRKPWAENNKYLERLLSQGECWYGAIMTKGIIAIHSVVKRTKLYSEWFLRENVPFRKKVYAFNWITLIAKRVDYYCHCCGNSPHSLVLIPF